MADNDLITPQIVNGGAGSAPSAGRVNAPDYRQLQNPEEVDVRHIDMAANEAGSEGVRLAGELGNAFKEFENFSYSVGSKLQAKAGAQAGAASDGTPKTGLAAITAYGDAYNAAAHTAYIANAKASAEERLTAIEQDAAGDPNSFATRAQAVADAVIKQAPDIYKPELQNDLALRINAGVARTREQSIQTARSDAFASYTDTYDSRITTAVKTAAALQGDQQTAAIQNALNFNKQLLDGLVTGRSIRPERAAILQQKFEDALEDAVHKNYTGNLVDHFMGYARAGDVDAADRALHQYLVDPNNLPEDKAEITKQYLAQADAFHQAQSRLHADDVATVGQTLAQGKYGADVEPQIHQLYKIGALSPEGLHSLMDQSMRNQVAAITDDSTNQLIDAAIHGGQKLDPENKEVAKAADKYFTTHIAISGVTPLSDVWTAGVSSFAKQTNIVPATALSQIRIGLLSGDPMQAARAAASAERIRSANPALDPFDKDPRTAALSNQINGNLKAGMAPAQAVQLATQTIDRDEGQRKIITKNYEQLIRQNPDTNTKALQSALDSATPGLFSHAPDVRANTALQAENERLVSTYYGLTQDLKTAQALAAKQLQTTWGVTRANGEPELVKYPPERLGVTPEMIRADVASSAAAAGYTGDASQIHLAPNAYTDGSNGRVWSLVHVDPQTGMSDVLLDSKNQPLVYHVPAGPDFAKAKEELIQQRLAAARAERDTQRQNSAEQIQYEQQLADQYLNGNSAQRAQAGR